MCSRHLIGCCVEFARLPVLAESNSPVKMFGIQNRLQGEGSVCDLSAGRNGDRDLFYEPGLFMFLIRV